MADIPIERFALSGTLVVNMPPVGRTAGGHLDPLINLLQPIWLRNWQQNYLSFVRLQSYHNLYTTTDQTQHAVTAAIWLRTGIVKYTYLQGWQRSQRSQAY